MTGVGSGTNLLLFLTWSVRFTSRSNPLAAQISELLSEQQHTAGAAATAETDLLPQAQPTVHALLQVPESTVNTDVIMVFNSADVGHFDLGFYVSLESDDNNSSIDLFL